MLKNRKSQKGSEQTARSEEVVVKRQAKTKDNEHIFPATRLEEAAMRWKRLVKGDRHDEALEVLEVITRDSTPMFERLAQFEGYSRTVELSVLVDAAQVKIPVWLKHWSRRKGHLFTYFSICAKNAFKSEIARLVQHRTRFHATSDNLEMFFGYEDHAVDRHELGETVYGALPSIISRWGGLQERGVIFYLVKAIMSDHHDRRLTVRGASYAWGLTLEMANFFYRYSLAAVREAIVDKVRIPFTNQDLFRQHFSYTQLPDWLNIITWDQMKRLISIHGGSRVRIPTTAQLMTIEQNYKTFLEIDACDKDPDSISKIAKRRKRSLKSAQAAFDEMVSTLDKRRSGEYEVFDQHGNFCE